MSEHDNNNNAKAFTQNMSPLDMLEKNSRDLANKLHTTNLNSNESNNNTTNNNSTSMKMRNQHNNSNNNTSDTFKIPTSSAAASRIPNNNRSSTASTASINRLPPSFQQQLQQKITIEDDGEWRPDDRASYISRTGSVCSTASSIMGGGGILDSFRLSKLPGVKDNLEEEFDFDNDDDSDRRSVSTFRAIDSKHFNNYNNEFNDNDNIYNNNDDNNNNSDDSDTNTIQEPSPVEPNDSASINIKQRKSFDSTTNRQKPPMNINTNLSNHHQDGGLLSPTSSINSDSSSIYTAKTHFSINSSTPSFQQQLQSSKRPQVNTSLSYHGATATNNNNSNNKQGTVTSPTTGNQYFFPDVVKQRSAQSSSNSQSPTSRSNSGNNSNNNAGLMIPPTLRSQSHSPHLSPKQNNKGFDDNNQGVVNKLFKDMTLDEHVTTGIALHEQGNLRESSYHWQYAAFKGENTAMLLYGLALRHGWGMRKNPTEAIKWLRNAMEKSLGEMDINTSMYTPGSRVTQIPISETKSSSLKKAHIGLALYELGMSYLHSWGTEKDETMALKSFEMAGSLGDTDALCEAASLYMKNGPKGRKKDLQKAARLYRQAGELGANMVGESWIYKDKYMDDKDKKKKKK